MDKLGDIFPMVVAAPYQANPVRLLESLQHSPGEHILLESAEIDSRQNLKSLLMVDASLKIVCHGQTVTAHALTDNGQCLLAFLKQQLSTYATSSTATSTTFTFAPAPANLSEHERLTYVANTEPLRVLQQQLNNTSKHPFGIFLAGVFAYDLLATFEQLPAVEQGQNTCPDYQFYLAETLFVIDHAKQQTELLGILATGDNPQQPALAANQEQRHQRLAQRMGELMSRMQSPAAAPPAPAPTVALDFTQIKSVPGRGEFKRIVQSMKTHIAAGDIFQVVPSRTFSVPCHNALASYAELKQRNPSPYMFYLRTNEFELFGASPESALKFTASNRQVELYPIAGTRSRARAADGSIRADQDSRIELALRQDTKELAEHMMLVDLARNDLARIATTGSRYVADLLKVDRYSHVMHLVSRVVATLRTDLDALDAYRACMNMGTLVGAPKISAASLIRHAEQCRRGSYGGAVGYLNGEGDMDNCIVIRSAFVQNGTAVVQAGAGVVFDSNDDAEVQETEQKAGAVLQAILQANHSAASQPQQGAPH